MSLALSAARSAVTELPRVESDGSAQILCLAVKVTPGRSSESSSADLAANALVWRPREAAGRCRTVAIAQAVAPLAPG